MKFFKKHKLFSFAVISFFVLSGVNFYIIFEFVRVIRSNVKNGPVLFLRKKRTGPLLRNFVPDLKRIHKIR